jgi:hypothetical protein
MQELGDGLAIVIDAALSKDLVTDIQNTGPMELRTAIDANKDAKLTLPPNVFVSRHSSSSGLGTAANVAPVLAHQRRGLPTGLWHGPPKTRRGSTLGSKRSPARGLSARRVLAIARTT